MSREAADMAFEAYQLAYELAARALARTPEACHNKDMQRAICRRYGLFLDSMNDDEAELLSRMTQEFINHR